MRDPVMKPRRDVLAGMLALSTLPLVPRVGRAAEDGVQRLLVFGDSQAQGLAGGVIRRFRSDRTRRVLDKTKISTGLTSRSSFDWPAQAKVLATGERADVAFALFGANDRPSVRVQGRVSPELLDRFTTTYSARAHDVAACFKRVSVPLVWVGHPVVKDPVYTEDMEILNDIYAEAAAANGAVFLSTWDLFKGADGKFSPYGRGVDGQTTRLRADDGVHMTPAGYDVITAMLSPYFERYRPDAPTQPSPVATPAGPAAARG